MNQLLTTKWFVPSLRSGLVHRPRLIRKMSSGLQGGSRLTLITAPAGYGKTTLALEWLEELGRPCGWLSIDREDNNPVQFLTYLIAALQQVDGALDGSWQAALEPTDEPDPATWIQPRLAALINRLAGGREPFVMVLDDYHTISDLAIHQIVEFILDHQPPRMHLVITTRQDPLLPLPRLRSRGQITEIRLGELRFNPDEADRFLNETMCLDLLPDQVAALEARTEGWIAGLQLAALSLSELPAWSRVTAQSNQRSKYIRAFTGDDRHIVDYLMDEVLSRQTEDVQRFLLQTSILKRLSGPLCDFVLNHNSQSADGKLSSTVYRPSSEVLEHLEHSNLFLIPLDNRRQWYRYHHLFADLLSSRLLSSQPDQVSMLHNRASQWYENAGIFAEAVDHALLAEDFDRALRLIEHAANTSIWASGDLPVLLNWSRRLPEEALMSRPRLCLYYARALFFNGQVDAAKSYMDAAENVLRARTASDRSTEELWGVLFTNQATFQAMQGDGLAALELASQAEGRVRGEDQSNQARIQHAVGMAEYLGGDVRKAEAAFTRAAHLSRQVGNRNLGLDVLSCLALTQILSGRLRQAAQTCQEALVADSENRRAPAASTLYLALAQVHYEQNNLVEARSSLETCLDLGKKAGWPHLLWQAYLLQVQVEQALGEAGLASEALQRAEGVAERYRVGRVGRMVAASRARFDLAEGRLEAAVRWAEEYQRQAAAGGLRDFEALTLARVLAAGGQVARALEIVAQLLSTADSYGRLASVIEASVLRSRLLVEVGDEEAGLGGLIRAIELAEPENFIRVFLNEGRVMAALLSRARRAPGTAAVIRYIGRLLAGFDEQGIGLDGIAPSAGGEPLGAPGVLIEPLSGRELEVLGLVAEGLTNPEIANRLYLSVNTLRAHTANIYQKLNVHNRVQAVARARELGLLREK